VCVAGFLYGARAAEAESRDTTPPVARAAARAAKKTVVPRLPADLKIVQDIVYKQAGQTKLDRLLFQPLEKKFERAPLVVYIHGGGWGGGDKFKMLRQDIIGVVREH